MSLALRILLMIFSVGFVDFVLQIADLRSHGENLYKSAEDENQKDEIHRADDAQLLCHANRNLRKKRQDKHKNRK